MMANVRQIVAVGGLLAVVWTLVVLPGCVETKSPEGSSTPKGGTIVPSGEGETSSPASSGAAGVSPVPRPGPTPVLEANQPDQGVPEDSWSDLAARVFPEGLPEVRRPLSIPLFRKAYDAGISTLWPKGRSRLKHFIDVRAARRFVRSVYGDVGINQVNALCTLFQLGDPLKDGKQLTRAAIWHFQSNAYVLFTRFLVLGEQPDASARARTVRFFYKQLLEVSARRDADIPLKERFELAVLLEVLRILKAPFPPAFVQALSSRVDTFPMNPDFPPDRMAALSWKAHLKTITADDRQWLTAFIEQNWNGKTFPNDGCGKAHCATKYLLRTVSLSYALGVDLGRERATQMAAYLVALQNPDGSFMTDLETGALEKSVDPLRTPRCSEFCQIHEWRYINLLSYLVDHYDLDPTEVKPLATQLKSLHR